MHNIRIKNHQYIRHRQYLIKIKSSEYWPFATCHFGLSLNCILYNLIKQAKKSTMLGIIDLFLAIMASKTSQLIGFLRFLGT